MAVEESKEMYLETILILSQKGETVRSIDISEYMGYSKPSVSRAMTILKDGGYIEEDYREGIVLTKKGKKKAEEVYDRHNTLTKMFESLGVDPKTAAEDACRIEHYISEKTFKAIKKHFLEFR
ncbi:MAG: metal-dependent transcriptional regulator [Clostridia bacterium]|nr:metal-dependent transcriptional regulator [Clostridia bacterium]